MAWQKTNAAIVIFSFLGFCLGIGARPAFDIIRTTLICNLECEAQLLYKNTAFFKVRGAVSSVLKNRPVKVTIDQTLFTNEYLRKNGVGLLVVLDSGEFILTSKIDDLTMLAKPMERDGRLIWQCQFFSETHSLPLERMCSY